MNDAEDSDSNAYFLTAIDLNQDYNFGKLKKIEKHQSSVQ